MNKRTLEIIAYMIREIRETSLDDIDLQLIMDILQEKGFSENDISAAMVWLVNHGETIDRMSKSRSSVVPRPVWRQLNEFERNAISTEAFSYLFHLRELNILNDDDMESIIERAVNMKLPKLDIQDMQDLIVMVVLDVEQNASAGFFQFTINRLSH
ncbi:DUF494 domain-containing protein [bacterium]|nr:DUF494 domain-containing protein [bacterium]